MLKIIALMAFIFLAFPAGAQNISALQNKLPEDRVLGKEDSKITLIEYASLSCSHCAHFHKDVLPEIQKNYIDTGKVRMIFRDFPLDKVALTGAQLAHCATLQGGDQKYFEALKAMFSGQEEWAFADDYRDKALKLLQDTGLDRTKLESCLDNDKEVETRVLNSRLGGQKLKVNSTPAFFLNGEKTDRMRSASTAAVAFDALLTGKSPEDITKENAREVMVARPTDLILGQSAAKVTVIEYLNVGCPHCAGFHRTLVEALKKDYLDTGKVKLVFRELPLSQAGFYAYMTAHCKGSSEFFNVLAFLIDDVQTWSSAPAFLTPLRMTAEKAGIAKGDFYACIENRDAENHIVNNSTEAKETLGISHSPTLYVNGEPVQKPDIASLRQMIDKEK